MYSNFTILHGSRNSGRSSLLFLIADIFKSNGKSCFFLGSTNEFDFSDSKSVNYTLDFNLLLGKFDRKFFYRNQDIRLIKNIVEISKKENCDYIFIDDIDYLPKDALHILCDSPVKKVCTSLTSELIGISDVAYYLLESKYDDSTLLEEKYLSHNGTKTILHQFIKSIEIDQKINSILK